MTRLKNETREEYNARYAIIQHAKYSKRKKEALEYLGGKCVDCGFRQGLEFDHRNPKEKSFNVSSRMNSAPWAVILSELDKCDLRCGPCHGFKTETYKLRNVDVLFSMLE